VQEVNIKPFGKNKQRKMEVLEACNNVGQHIDAALSNFATTYEEGKRKIEEATEILLSIKRDFEQSNVLVYVIIRASQPFLYSCTYLLFYSIFRERG
jgi:hypothetical protein